MIALTLLRIIDSCLFTRAQSFSKEVGHLITELRALPLEIDAVSTERALEETLALAKKHDLTTYDASYLKLAQRRNLPLATLDTKLRKACVSAKIPLLPSQIALDATSAK